MNPTRTALVLIDMQQESKYGIEGVEEAVAATVPLLAACRSHRIPVIYTRQVNQVNGVGLPNGEVLDADGKPVYYRSDSAMKEIIADIAPQPTDIVIDKQRWSGFHGTNLDLTLRSLGIEHIITGGFVTDGCVLTTVFDAYARDYQVDLVKDISAATNSGAHKSAILTMANWVYDLEIFDAAELIAKLEGREYRSWSSAGPDEMQFTGGTLDDVFRALG